MKTVARGFLICGAVAALVACSKTATPEARVRAAVDRAEVAAEGRQVPELRDMISKQYADARGHDKRAIEGLLRYYFLRNQTVHLFTRIASVTLPDARRAVAVVHVAMAAQPVADVDELERMRADLFRFEITFADEDGEWRVVGADWRRAEPADFIY